MEDVKKGVGKASALLLRSGANGVMLEETDAGPAIIHGGKVYFPWSEVAWELRDDKVTLVKEDWDPKPIEGLLGKWERGTITTVGWEELEMAKKKREMKDAMKAKMPENKYGGSPIPGDPGKVTKPQGKVQNAAPAPKTQGKGRPAPPPAIPKAPATAGKAPVKAPATPATPPPPVWKEQDSYLRGVKETVDVNLYTNHIKCEECGADRWTKVQDAFQVTRCKPCAKKARRKRRSTHKKERIAAANAPKPSPKPSPKVRG